MSTPDLPRHRVALPADEAVVLAFMRDFYAEEHLSFDQLIAQRALRELLADPRLGIVLLMETRAGTIGYLVLTFGFSLEFHGRYALLDELYLVPAARGHGWGKHALHQAALAAREQRVNSLRLEVNHANAHARSLYLKSGFLDDQREMFTHWL